MIILGDKVMKCYLCWIVVVEFLFVVGNFYVVEVEVLGLLIDYIVLFIGYDFYWVFSDKWESDYMGNLMINERFSVWWGSWIIIMVN